METRQKIFREIEKKSHERGDLESLVNKRNKEVPEAQARFLKKSKIITQSKKLIVIVHDIELKKKEEDLRSRSPERNVLYNFYALDNNSQRKVRKKLQAQLSGVSRFSDI